ncbi:bifunctional UDP-N-acetylglucosamine diphosphorylase/glucosamine-1-phosphate N-acetyltransferase GlmU [bacterium]|nr:MAG: bifunctional UDP-N-acetylglucosamine diphosphorylase/glucosamine-1-phosphate N-acetyltransferase GlmU [bacterium]
MKISSVVLAAGHGTRMKSELPKMLHPLAGRPLVMHALSAAAALADEPPVVVVGHGEDSVRKAVGSAARFAVQEKQLGTANAVQAAETLLGNETGLILVTYADMPLLRSETLRHLVAMQLENPGPLTMLSVVLDDPHGFGRVVRGGDGRVLAIVEEAVATPIQLAVRELNASAFVFRAEWLWPALRRVRMSPKGEYYLTDLVEIAVADGLQVRAYCTPDPTEAVGVNTRVHLAEVETILRGRINTAWMLAGVSMIDPATTYIEPEVEIGRDTVIHPNTCLRGHTRIGMNCVLGSNTIVMNSLVGDGCTLTASILEDTEVAAGTHLAPYSHLKGERTGRTG